MSLQDIGVVLDEEIETPVFRRPRLLPVLAFVILLGAEGETGPSSCRRSWHVRSGPARRFAPPPGPPIEAKEFRNTARGASGDTALHTRNFLDCVKSRQKPICELEIGFYSSLPCLLALMSIQQGGRTIAWDGKTAKPV